MRLRADVHVGSCLSGGLDSSSIVCLVNKIREKEIIPGNQMTFSSCSEIKKFDEREYIDEVVKKNCNIKAYYTYPSLKVLCDNLDKIIWHQDEPFSTTSIFAQWQVFQLASQNDVKVMLDGQGADEQLCGYHIFFSLRQADLFKKLKWGTMVSEIINVRKIHRKPIRNSIFEIVTSFLPSKWKYLFITFLNPKSISSFWVNARQIKKTPEIILFPELNASSSIKKESYRELIFTSLPMLLHWEDRDSMAHSVESRVPFLDYRVVEFIFSLPDEFKIRRETTKIILRESLNTG
jgi:asparagine synthase (glutamine-hydrolysing)